MHRFAGWVLLTVLMAVASGITARADEDAETRELYIKTCSKCHGVIQEDELSWRRDYFYQPAVTLPLGPTLTGVYLRPAGIIEGYPYSKAFRELASGWVWDTDALDGWLTSSQEFIRGSTMYLKVAEPTRGKIIAYLMKYAHYKKP